MEKKNAKKVLLAIMGVLIIVVIVLRIATIQVSPVSAVAQLISLVFAALYGFWLYKKPHGNMLKYAMLLFALANIISSSYHLLIGQEFNVAKIMASAAVCYCAGRLGRIDQNKYILPVIGIVLFGVSIVLAIDQIADGNNILLILSSFNFTINYITLMIAYFVRFEEHKLAGLTDAPKN